MNNDVVRGAQSYGFSGRQFCGRFRVEDDRMLSQPRGRSLGWFTHAARPASDQARLRIAIQHRRAALMAIFAAMASHIESIRGRDAAVPMSRVLNRAFLVAEICVDQSIALGEALGPLEIIE